MSNPSQIDSGSRVLEWRVIDPDTKRGVLLALPLDDPVRVQDASLSKRILAVLDGIDTNDMAMLHDNQKRKDAMTAVLESMSGGRGRRCCPVSREVASTSSSALAASATATATTRVATATTSMIDTTPLDVATFQQQWRDQIEPMIHAHPWIMAHECNSGWCALTRGPTATRQLATLSLNADMRHYVYPVYKAACKQAQDQGLAEPPFVYMAFAAGGFGYDLIQCRHLYDAGVQKLKLVSVSHTHDFIEFLMEQEAEGKTSGFASLDQWTDTDFTADMLILLDDDVRQRESRKPKKQGEEDVQPASPSSQETFAETIKELGNSLGTPPRLMQMAPEDPRDVAVREARTRRQRWVWMHRQREQFYSMLQVLYQIGFQEVSFHLCTHAPDVFQQDPQLRGAVHLLVGMDTMDDTGGLKTLTHFQWLARHALMRNGVATHCYKAGGWDHAVHFMQTLQQDEPPEVLSNPDDPDRPNVETLKDLLPATHRVLLFAENRGPVGLAWSFLKHTGAHALYSRRHELALAAVGMATFSIAVIGLLRRRR